MPKECAVVLSDVQVFSPRCKDIVRNQENRSLRATAECNISFLCMPQGLIEMTTHAKPTRNFPALRVNAHMLARYKTSVLCCLGRTGSDWRSLGGGAGRTCEYVLPQQTAFTSRIAP